MHRLGSVAWRVSPMLVRYYKAAVAQEPFLTGTSATYIEELYNIWEKDHSSVHSSWDAFFQKASTESLSVTQRMSQPLTGEMAVVPSIDEYLAMQSIIRAYQSRGHLVAQVDPLNIKYGVLESHLKVRKPGEPSEKVVRHHMSKLGNSPEAMKKEYILPDSTFIGGGQDRLSLQEILIRLENAYCKHIGVEYMHITSLKKLQWIRQRFEPPGVMVQSTEQKRLTANRLVHSTEFEVFLARKWSSEKRFGLEGCEVLIPAMRQIIDKACASGGISFVMGMSHRGRLNVLVNVCKIPMHTLFTQFTALAPSDNGSGDVKYHLGTSTVRKHYVTNQDIRLSLVANPSHLEACNPITQGKARAEQFKLGDTEGAKVWPIQCHGDAAFSSEGIVYETINLSNLPCFTTHGTIHFIINNQVGFTTDPRFSRSSPYSTDVARVVNAPIFHVNADYPDEVIHCCNVAADYRSKFHSDIVIDLVCYRRNGHNELDEPMFTQPLMYKIIKKMETVKELYFKQLIKEKVATKEELEEEVTRYKDVCESEFQVAAKETSMKWKDWMDSPWEGFFDGKDPLKVPPTGVEEDILIHIGNVVSNPPPKELNFEIHRGLDRILKMRRTMLETRTIDWALGEMMAIGSLLKEGTHVRLSGEDVERGTFSHRHHVLHHQSRDKEMYIPLQNLFPGVQAKYTVCNSSISEFAVLGFEAGYSMTDPHWLVIWEAQFGDFNNMAQPIIDQYLAGGESKWNRPSGLVMLNPHGMEGMGPEHSSAHVERFLQLCDDDPDSMPDIKDPNLVALQLKNINWIVANCSTPGNLFHILRRQIAMPFRKPLILFTPKSLLRHPDVKSSFDDIKEGTEFVRLIPEAGPAAKTPEEVKKLIFCSGKVYYDMTKEREARGLESSIAIACLEQLCPFPYDLVIKEISLYANAELCWAQEEHKNYGAWGYVLQRLATALCGTNRDIITYIGRAVSAAPATGSKAVYAQELKEMLDAAMSIERNPIMSIRSAKPCAPFIILK